MKQALLFLLLAGCWLTTEGTKRNFVFILIDDAGWSDIHYNDRRMRTPNIEKLREDGVFLDQSYGHPMCAPTRSAIMTGRYPHTIGSQDGRVLGGNSMFFINESLTFIPKHLKDEGYTTHLVGKWHLGLCHPGLRPLGRGFESSYGMLTGSHKSYYTHISKPGIYDFWDGNELDKSAKGKYKTELFAKRAAKIIRKWDGSKPFFLYLAFASPHAPLQVPWRYINRHCRHLKAGDRRTVCGMMAAVDKGVGKVVKALKKKGVYDTTSILFMSDNGGPIKTAHSNYPLRGGKKGVYEGGTRLVTILKDSRLKPNRTWSGLAHDIDWFPTIVSMLGGSKPRGVHGKDLFPSIRDNSEGPRHNFLYTVNDYKFRHTAFRYNKRWKLIKGIPGIFNGWYPPDYLISDTVKRIDVRKTEFSHSTYQLFDLKQDPYEHNNLYRHKDLQGLVKDIKVALADQLRRYPVQALDISRFKKGKITANRTYKDCFCSPPTLPPCPGE